MKLRFRFFITLSIALMVGLSFWVVGAKAENHKYQEMTPDCQGCHDVIREHWEEGSHGQAYSNPAFQSAWNLQGQPGECLACHTTGYDPATNSVEYEGVACTVCHTPVNDNHPLEVMPTNVSSRDCGNCHIDTFAEWEISAHAQEDLSCNKCHNSHTASIKAEDAQILCQSCHKDEIHYSDNTTHAQEGLLCIDCHLTVSETEIGNGHGSREHSFAVNMDTCAKCHIDTLNLEAAGMDIDEEILQSGLIPNFEKNTMEQPDNVSPIGFAILGTLIGMAVGMLLSPWLEKWFARFNRG